MNSAGILLQNSGVLQSRSIFCPAELMWFSISMRYWTIWPLTHGKQEVADEGSGFLVMIWHANCSSQDATRNLHNKCIYSRILNIFFSNLLSYSFQKAITDILHWWIGYKEFTMHHVTAMCPRCTLSIDVFYIFVDASLWGYSEICINAMYMKHWQGWGEYLTGRREISLIILVHITHPCLTTESKQSIFSI